MTASLDVSIRQIEKAAEALRCIKPVYESLLTFYQRMFISQEQSKINIDLEPITLSEDDVVLKQEAYLPLVDMAEFSVDTASSASLLVEICQIIKDFNTEMAPAAKMIYKAFGSDIDAEELFKALIGSQDAYFEKITGKIDVDKPALAFVAYNSIKPSLMMCAEQLAGYLGEPENWLKGYCPVCGNAPGISILDDKGTQYLYCSFCWHQWPIARGKCPFCSQPDRSDHHYFYSETEDGYRVDVCDGCKKYLKTVDMRKTEHVVYAPLEMVASLHLDMQARDLGFESSLALQIP
jgi:FdhE protein